MPSASSPTPPRKPRYALARLLHHLHPHRPRARLATHHARCLRRAARRDRSLLHRRPRNRRPQDVESERRARRRLTLLLDDVCRTLGCYAPLNFWGPRSARSSARPSPPSASKLPTSPRKLGINPVQRPRERNRLAHMLQPADPRHAALDPHPKTRVRHAAVLPQI
jgi:hypothetical protein